VTGLNFHFRSMYSVVYTEPLEKKIKHTTQLLVYILNTKLN